MTVGLNKAFLAYHAGGITDLLMYTFLSKTIPMYAVTRCPKWFELYVP